MNCNCNRNGNNCGLPSQPNYNNLNKGFVVPKKGCCDCEDEDKICRNGKIVTIDKNHLYPQEGIYLEDKPDGNQILHITLRPNDYTYIVNFNNTDNFYVTHMFITYKEDNINNCNNIYRLYINNQRDSDIEIRIDDNLKQFNNFYVRELDGYINEPDKFKYLKGKFFKLRSMRNLEIEVSKPMNSIRMYCDDNILKNNLKHSQKYIISNIYTDDYSGYINIEIKDNPQPIIIVDAYCFGINISLNPINDYPDVTSEYKLFIYYGYDTDDLVIDVPIIWANDNPPEFEIDNLYEISISYINGMYFGVFTKYPY